jgi:hypothetical protein
VQKDATAHLQLLKVTFDHFRRFTLGSTRFQSDKKQRSIRAFRPKLIGNVVCTCLMLFLITVSLRKAHSVVHHLLQFTIVETFRIITE